MKLPITRRRDTPCLLYTSEQGVESAVEADAMWGITKGRLGTLENGKKAVAMGVDFIVLTGNPGVGVTNRAIAETLALYRKEFGDAVVLVAGKMHAAGILSEAGEKIITREDVKQFQMCIRDRMYTNLI